MDGPPPAHKHCGVILTENRAEGRNIQRRARSVLLCKDCFCCLCLHMLRYIAAPVSHLWANYKEIIRSVHVSYTQRTARCWLHLPAAWTFTPVGRSADLTWLACSYHLLESTSSGVHKASKAAAIFNVVFGLRVYYRLQREKFSFCDLIRRSCEVGVSICDWEVCIWGVWIRCHPSNKCVPALLIYSTAVTQHHSVSCCQKFEPQTYRTSEMLFYGDRRTTNVLQVAADCAFSAIRPLHLHPEWRVLLTATFKERPASKYNYTQLCCIIMK